MSPKNRPKRTRPAKPRHPGRHKGLVLLHQLVATARRAADLAEEFLHEHGEACRCPTCRYFVQEIGVGAGDVRQRHQVAAEKEQVILPVVRDEDATLDGSIPRLPPEELRKHVRELVDREVDAE